MLIHFEVLQIQVFAYIVKLCMPQCFARQDSTWVILYQHFVQYVYRLEVCQMLILLHHKTWPWFLFHVTYFFKIRELNLLILYLFYEVLCSQNFHYFFELIEIRHTPKEWFFFENDGGKHAAQTPNVQTLVLHLLVHQQFRPLELTRCDSHRQVASREKEFGQSPVNQAHTVSFRVDHNVVWLHISMHYSVWVRLVQGSQHLEHLQTEFVVWDFVLQLPEIFVINIFENQGWSFADWILDNL